MNKFSLKIISLVIAFIIWLLVMNVQNPARTVTYYDIPVTFSNTSYIESTNNIALMVEGKDTVSVRVMAESKIISNLDKTDITAVADLTQIIDMNSQPIMVPVSVNCPGIRDENIEVMPKNIPIVLEKRESIDRIISPELIGESKPEKNFEVGKATATPEKVTITGPKSVISKIDNVTAQIDVNGMSQSGMKKGKLKVYDKNHDELTEKQMSYIKFDIPSTTVDVKVDLWRLVPDIYINASFAYSGNPAAGYQVDSVTSTPEKVSIVGSEDALRQFTAAGNKITIPSSEERDISGKTSDCDFSVDLSEYLSKDIRLAAGLNNTALLKVKILPYNSKEYKVSADDIIINNRPEDVNVVLDKAEVLVRVEGKKEELNKLDKKDIKLSIDLKSYQEAGEYEIPAKIELPEGYQAVDEVLVKVRITNKDEVAEDEA